MKGTVFESTVGTYYVVGKFWLDCHTMLEYNASIECNGLYLGGDETTKWGLKTPTAARAWLNQNKERVLRKLRQAYRKEQASHDAYRREWNNRQRVEALMHEYVNGPDFDHLEYYHNIKASVTDPVGMGSTIKQYYGALRCIADAVKGYDLKEQGIAKAIAMVIDGGLVHAKLHDTHKDTAAIPFIKRYMKGAK